MGINIPANSNLGSVSSQFFFIFFFFSAKMNLTVFAGILLAVTMATARIASLGGKIMRAADEADEPAGAKRANGAFCTPKWQVCNTDYNHCCKGMSCQKNSVCGVNFEDTLKKPSRECIPGKELCTKDSDCCSYYCYPETAVPRHCSY